MKKIIISLLFLNIFLNASFLDKNFSFAVNLNNYNKIYQNKIESSFIRISKEFEELQQNKYKVNISLIKEKKVPLTYINYSEYNAFISNSSFYLENQNLLKKYSKNFFVFNHSKEYQKYILIVNKKANIKTIKDLKGKRFISFVKNNNEWLDYLTLKELNETYKNLVTITNVEKNTTLVYDLYFDKADFTVIRKSVFEDIVSLNPAILKNVSIIKESNPIFLYGIGMLHKKTPQEMVETFNSILEEGVYKNSFKQILKMLENAKLKRISLEDLVELENFYKEYMQLKRLYNGKNK